LLKACILVISCTSFGLEPSFKSFCLTWTEFKNSEPDLDRKLRQSAHHHCFIAAAEVALV